MRTDVKVFLICLAVVVVLVVAYFAFFHHSNSSSRQITAENVLPSQQPTLTPTTPTPNSNPLTPAANSGGVANVPSDTGISSGVVPPANSIPATTEPGLVATSPPTTLQGQIQPGGQVTMNSPGIPATTDNLNPSDNGTGTANLNQNTTSDNSAGNAGSLAGLQGETGSTHRHHARTYVIRHGDTLAAIARRIYGNIRMVRSIERANPGVDPRDLRVGQKLRLPHHHAIAQSSARSHSRWTRTHGRLTAHERRRHSAAGSRTYIVRPGDTLINIARKEYHRAADWKLIYRANRRQIGSRPGDIRVGEKLLIPAR